MKRHSFGLLGLGILVLTSCNSHAARTPIENFTGVLIGEMNQSKLGEAKEGIKDQFFHFSVKVTAEASVIKKVEWNTDKEDLLYVKEAWGQENCDKITADCPSFFALFADLSFSSFYDSLIAKEDSTDRKVSVLFDDVTFASGVNKSDYTFWSDNKDNSATLKSQGRLVEVGVILSVFLAITK